MCSVDIQKRTIGVNFNSGVAEAWLWAPKAEQVELSISGKEKIQLQKKEFGYWHIITPVLQPGDRYAFILNSEKELPDPASLSQPEGVHAFSEAIDLNKFEWTDQSWSNPLLNTYIFYELHVGTFTKEGNFKALGEKLDHLKELGITAIELMPLAVFPGNRNWGYDGVFPFAIHESYGGAKELQKLVNLCHAKGIAVVLDAVYNHLGPEGNYLGEFAPYFTEKYKTPWGHAINFDDADCDGVRKYFIENALMWFRDFHIDALRLDAVHAIKDLGAVHILHELRQAVDGLSALTGKAYYLIAECDLNDPKFIRPVNEHGYGMHGQWIDEFHHALRISAGQKPTGYYTDFNGIAHLAKAYKDAYIYDGMYSKHRKKKFGLKTENNPGEQFVVFSQNHDQVGNRMLGERTSTLQSFEMQKLMAAAVLVSPYLPLLFMGEEWSETHPFLYFVSHTDAELADAVRKGRKAEFKDFHNEGEAPDPLLEETYKRSKLQWELLDQERHQTMFLFYKTLIAIRKRHLPLEKFTRNQLHITYNETEKTIQLQRWHGNQQVLCFMNFSDQPHTIHLPEDDYLWHMVIDSADKRWLGDGNRPATAPAGSETKLHAESFLMYTNKHV